MRLFRPLPLLAGLGLAGCAGLPPAEGPLRPWQVVQLREHATQLRDSDQLVSDAALSAYLREWMVRIDPIAAAQIELFVLDLPDTQADVVAGRLLRMRLGLLRQLHSESELAFVLAHELAHVALGHTAQQLDGSLDAGSAEVSADAAAQETLQRLGLSPHAGVELLRRLQAVNQVSHVPEEREQLRTRLEALAPAVPQVCLRPMGGDAARFDAMLAPYRD